MNAETIFPAKVALKMARESGIIKAISCKSENERATVYTERSDQKEGQGLTTEFTAGEAYRHKVWTKHGPISLLEKWTRFGFDVRKMLLSHALGKNLEAQCPEIFQEIQPNE